MGETVQMWAIKGPTGEIVVTYSTHAKASSKVGLWSYHPNPKAQFSVVPVEVREIDPATLNKEQDKP